MEDKGPILLYDHQMETDEKWVSCTVLSATRQIPKHSVKLR